jgi:hypothetical protein
MLTNQRKLRWTQTLVELEPSLKSIDGLLSPDFQNPCEQVSSGPQHPYPPQAAQHREPTDHAKDGAIAPSGLA